jgi:hypothetical protein
MVAYIVFTRERTRNQAELDTYSQKVPASMPGHAVTPRASYGRLEVLEGAAVERRRLSRRHRPRRVTRSALGPVRRSIYRQTAPSTSRRILRRGVFSPRKDQDDYTATFQSVHKRPHAPQIAGRAL